MNYSKLIKNAITFKRKYVPRNNIPLDITPAQKIDFPYNIRDYNEKFYDNVPFHSDEEDQFDKDIATIKEDNRIRREQNKRERDAEIERRLYEFDLTHSSDELPPDDLFLDLDKDEDENGGDEEENIYNFYEVSPYHTQSDADKDIENFDAELDHEQYGEESDLSPEELNLIEGDAIESDPRFNRAPNSRDPSSGTTRKTKPFISETERNLRRYFAEDEDSEEDISPEELNLIEGDLIENDPRF